MPSSAADWDFEALVQSGCRDALAALQFFTPETGVAIPVLCESLGDITAQVEATVAKLGVCVILLTPTADNPHPDSYGCEHSVDLVAAVVEHVTVNRSAAGTGQPAALIASVVERTLHHFTIPGTALTLAFKRRALGRFPGRASRLVGFTTFWQPPDDDPPRLPHP